MLDACAALVDELGYEGLTTTLIAQRAGVAIGSVYQFFPDKRAVVQALTVRHLEAFLNNLNTRLDARLGDGVADWWAIVDAVIDEYIHMHRAEPGFRTLHFGDVVDVHLLDADRDNNDVIAQRLQELIIDRLGLVDRPGLRFALAIGVETGDALINLAFRRDPEGDKEILDEAKVLIRDYLSRHVN
ncbi:TetR family transcriptional regulator [Actinorhabdospora filicis]|uniref:TetR family transcriptional regulator n=1 Tax=Actinorhabdospora filicis TaxID=1785913 RepID=A0A9W6SQS7_9ACTN|nr:TetR family transcriptional regulator [Actinorhabdospora filicis]GLZ80472.1 TetR family transcriptional regulator [Actinorhabdospora filicis]